MNELSNDLKDKLESTIITRPFNISGMPIAVWEEVNLFCKEHYGDSRWTMLVDLIRLAKDDWRFKALQEQIDNIREDMAMLSQKEVKPEKTGRVPKTFGNME